MPVELTSGLRKLKVDFKLLSAFRNWLDQTQSHSNNCLWLPGKSASKLSAILCDAGKSAKLPLIAFHCTQLDQDGNPMTSEDLLKSMVYAFLYQLLEFLQMTPGARQTIDDRSVADLADRSRSSIPRAITLFENLLDRMPRECLCVIDGFQKLESNGGQRREANLRNFIAAFGRRREGADAHSNESHKLLLTTVGGTEMLTDLSLSGRITQQPSDTHVKSGQVGHVLSRELRALMGANV